MELSRYKDIVYEIIGSAMAVHHEFGSGLLEPIYQEALSLELLMHGLSNQREEELRVFYKGIELEKRYKMDIVVDDIIVELKSTIRLLPTHRAQLCNYLRLSKKPIGLLINFGESRLIAERWAYNKYNNKCYIVDKNLNQVFGEDYDSLLDTETSVHN